MHTRRVVSCAIVGALFLSLLPRAAEAQNGSNYHILTNGMDVMYLGVGAGGTQTKQDGLGTWIAGEDLKGSHLLGSTGDFGQRLVGLREQACVMHDPVGGGLLAIKFRGLILLELDGLNAHAQAVFTNPTCPVPGPSFPLGANGFVPYGTPPGASVSFFTAGVPSSFGFTFSAGLVVPNNGYQPSGLNGTISLVGAFPDITIPIPSDGFCWGVQFSFIPSGLGLHDDIDGLWHYLINSDDGNQYWGFSDDELNLWQSNSVASDNDLTSIQYFPANADYELLLLTAQPSTMATLAPVGRHLAGAYYTQTEGVHNEFGVELNPNGGFDVGRGSAAISLSGTAGVANPVTGLGNQNPDNNPGKVPTLGFLTWDNGGDQDGSVRFTWVSVDLLGQSGRNPAVDPGLTQLGGTIRMPVVSAGFPQVVTRDCSKVYGHVTQVGFPDPGGYPAGSFGVSSVAGASWQIPVGTAPPFCMGLPLNVTYGTSGMTGVLGAPGSQTFDPSVADTSGTRELYIFN
jgi:hypothetical protein